ncbi:MAG: serine/threonine protein kinase [Myxococcales bacterium]|nr:serine/threonine protein kinase [Myxococcales bacterium]
MASAARSPVSIDGYRVVRRIGVGGTGETFEVLWIGDDGTEGRGCLKWLHAHRAEDAQSRELFAREARIAGRLQHPNLVSILGHKLDADRPYVVFAFVDGVDLRVLRENGRLTPEQVLWIGNRVAAALHYAHSYCDGEIRGVVHRDVTPGNILVSVEGVVKLADFGLARVRTHGTASLTVESEVKGTLPYLAPELMVGGKASERSDLYGLGAVLYELAIGEPPFAGSNSYELIKKVCEGQLDGPPLGEGAKAFPAEFVALVEAMLAREPEARPESALEVQLQLEACGGSRRERRRLGAIVRETQDNLETSRAAEVTPVDLDVANQSEPRPQPSPRAEKNSRRKTLLGALAVLGMVGLAGIMMGRGGAADNAQEVENGVAVRTEVLGEPERNAPPEEPTTKAVGAVMAAPVPQTAAPGVEESPQTEPQAAAKRERALLRVFANPWGNVWINDEKIGRAPVRRSVRPGTYKVQIGDEYPEEPKYVKVRAGESRKITLRKAEIE